MGFGNWGFTTKPRGLPRLRRFAAAAALVLVLVVVARAFLWGEIRAYLYRGYAEVREVTASDWFDYPVGAPNAKGYYRAQKFGGRDLHLGEDWNGVGGGNSDYGDRIYAIANGKVSYSDHVRLGWGHVVMIVHPVGIGEEPVEAVYGHLAERRVREGQTVKRGQVIGTMGDADGYYPAHLHFEIRKRAGLPLGGGYGDNDDELFLDPTRFIDRHRKRRPG